MYLTMGIPLTSRHDPYIVASNLHAIAGSLLHNKGIPRKKLIKQVVSL